MITIPIKIIVIFEKERGNSTRSTTRVQDFEKMRRKERKRRRRERGQERKRRKRE